MRASSARRGCACAAGTRRWRCGDDLPGPSLTGEEAARLLRVHGPNVLAEPRRPSHPRRFGANLVHLFALLLWLGAALALLGGLPELSIPIVAVILVSAVFAFAQEYRAERASEALRRVLPQVALPFLAWALAGGAIPLPLTVMQVLAIDLGTDMLPAIALGTERPEEGAMTRPPRPRGERLLSRVVLARVYGFVGLLEGLGALASFFLGYLFGAGGRRPACPRKAPTCRRRP